MPTYCASLYFAWSIKIISNLKRELKRECDKLTSELFDILANTICATRSQTDRWVKLASQIGLSYAVKSQTVGSVQMVNNTVASYGHYECSS